MSLHFFAIPALDSAGAQEALNTASRKPPC